MKSCKVIFAYLITSFTLVSGCNQDDLSSISASAGNVEQSSQNLTVFVEDPLYKYQWHLKNDGVSRISGVGPQLAGADINLTTPEGEPLTTITGKGVKVAVIDSGLEIDHLDLRDRVVAGSWDFIGNDNNPTSDSRDGDHGTSVAGIIAATEMNGIGGRGVSPGVSLIATNYIESNQTETEYYESHGSGDGINKPYTANVDIFNLSYASAVSNLITSPKKEITHTLKTCNVAGFCAGGQALRDGKGAIYVKGAGNYFYLIGSLCDRSKQIDLTLVDPSCHNTNMEFDNALPYNIVVGALTARDTKTSYSSIGSSLWISGYGGEYGVSKEIFPLIKDYYSEPAIITTDQTGCSAGYLQGIFEENQIYVNGFDNPNTATDYQNDNCLYTSLFNGTSAATPVVSGVVALMLEANPELSWRDVKHILAKTATKVDTDILDGVRNGIIHTPSWLVNAAGYNFHNWYGFGKVNAGAAVAMAKNYQADLGNFIEFESATKLENFTLQQNIAENTFSLNIDANLIIESVSLETNITLSKMGALQFELISPKGTKSVLFHAYNFLYDLEESGKIGGSNSGSTQDKPNYKGEIMLTSNAFYGEGANGNWQLKLIKGPELNGTNTLNDWSLIIYGH